MILRRVRTFLVPASFLIGFIAIGVLVLSQSASALPPAGSDTFNITAEVGVASRLGEEIIPLTGTFGVERSDPVVDAITGVEVVSVEVVSIDLQGESVTGPVAVFHNPDFPSTGEIRSLQEPPIQFPADSFFDIFVEAGLPISGSRSSPTVHNEIPLRLVPMEDGNQVPLAAWPPVGVTYEANPQECVPLLPELPAEICVTHVSIVMGDIKTPTPTFTPCPPESCTPTPSSTPTQTPCPIEVCPLTPTHTAIPPTPTSTPTEPPLPEDPTFSVAPGGPSGAHPADFLGLGDAAVVPAGNDNFAGAFEINRFPFSGVQNTISATTEPGENLTPTDCALGSNFKGATVWYRFTAPVSSTMIASTQGSNFDTVLVIYSGDSLETLSALDCNDDSAGLQSELSLPLSQGTTYYLQAGGFRGTSGTLVLLVDFAGIGGAETGRQGFILCASLGLTADGCDDGSDGDQDDLDAISFGLDFEPGESAFAFSVAPGSRGLGSSGVAQQAACIPAQPQADEFMTNADGSNELFFDGDGIGAACPTSNSLGLIEGPSSDDLDALNEQPPSSVDELRDGTLDGIVFISLSVGSPSLETLDVGAADILWTVGFTPGVYASAASLGLLSGDDIDGMCINDFGGGPAFDPETDTVLFSLAPGSPTLADLGASAADVLEPGPRVHFRAGQIGLRVSDDINALKCFRKASPDVETVAVGDIYFCDASFQGAVCDTTIDPGMTVQWDFGTSDLPHTVTECGETCEDPTASPLFDSGVIDDGSTFEFTFDTPGTYLYYCVIHPQQHRGRIIVLSVGDVNCSGDVSAIDATLLLQLIAGLVGSLSCEANADVNGDGTINSIDSVLILQFTAGLLDQLPP